MKRAAMELTPYHKFGGQLFYTTQRIWKDLGTKVLMAGQKTNSLTTGVNSAYKNHAELHRERREISVKPCRTRRSLRETKLCPFSFFSLMCLQHFVPLLYLEKNLLL